LTCPLFGSFIDYRLNPVISFIFDADLTNISRDNANEYEVTKDTTKYSAKLEANVKPSATMRSKIYYKYTKIDNPFTFFKAGCAKDFTSMIAATILNTMGLLVECICGAYKAGVNLSYLTTDKINFFGGYNFLGEKYDSILYASYYDG
jgi:hypothetical protein